MDPDHPVRLLLERLGKRGFVAGYGGGITESIHGWLNTAATTILANHLSALHLPEYE